MHPEIHSPMPGIATYLNEQGYRVIIWHYSSDPVKDEEWVREASKRTPGGFNGDDWQQEEEINHHVVAGRPTYYAFSRSRNVISELPVDIKSFRLWTHFLSVDYGGGAAPTCWLFWAENPVTKEILIYDSVYVHVDGEMAWPEEKRSVGSISRVVYDVIRKWFDLPFNEVFDIRSYISYSIGDPSGRGFALEYSQSSFPIFIGMGTDNPAMPKINDVIAGEQRVNSYLSPAFLCCPNSKGVKQPVFAEWSECPICGIKRKGEPRLRILGKNCPELVHQLETLRKRVPNRPELEQSSQNVKSPDHAVDSCRYGAMTRSPEGARSETVEVKATEDLDVASVAFHKKLDGISRKVAEEYRENLESLPFDDGCGIFPLYPDSSDEKEGFPWM